MINVLLLISSLSILLVTLSLYFCAFTVDCCRSKWFVGCGITCIVAWAWLLSIHSFMYWNLTMVRSAVFLKIESQ